MATVTGDGRVSIQESPRRHGFFDWSTKKSSLSPTVDQARAMVGYSSQHGIKPELAQKLSNEVSHLPDEALVPYLQALPTLRWRRGIDCAIISHADRDHLVGYRALAESGFQITIANIDESFRNAVKLNRRLRLFVLCILRYGHRQPHAQPSTQFNFHHITPPVRYTPPAAS